MQFMILPKPEFPPGEALTSTFVTKFAASWSPGTWIRKYVFCVALSQEIGCKLEIWGFYFSAS